MMMKLPKLLLIALSILLVLGAGSLALAGSNVEVFVDLDGDGFDDNESDVNKDGVPDLVCPVEAPKMLASASDIFGGSMVTPPVPALQKTNAQHFGLRSFSIRALVSNRASFSTGFDEIGSGAALGAEACPGGNCGI